MNPWNMENFAKGSPLLMFSICFLHCVHHAYCEEFKGLNLALGKPTWQYPPGIALSNRAVDGNIGPLFSIQSCSHTADKQSKEPASWSVDLMELFYITGIKIFNRKYHEGRLRRFRLYGFPGNVTLYDDATQLSPQYKNVEIYVPLVSDKRYRNITVYLPTVEGQDTILTLCEVQIYGGCKLPVVDNGYVINANGSQMNSKIVVTYGTKLKVICSPGHQLGNKDNTLICGYNYTWDKPDPICKAFACEALTLNNGNYTYNQSSYNNFFPFGSVATAECNKGFKLQGPRQRTCQSDDSWDDGNTHCTIVMCDHPGGFDHGNYTKNSTEIYISGSVVYNTKIETICEKGYILNSSQTVQRKCTAHGNWSGSTPKCSSVKCDELENTTNSMFRILNSTYNIYPGYRSTIEWICNGDYYTVAEIQTCTENGLWSGKRPACKKHEEEGLQVKVIAGLSGGVVAVVLAVLALLIVLKKRRSSEKKANRYLHSTITTDSGYVNSSMSRTVTSETGTEEVHVYYNTSSGDDTKENAYSGFSTRKKLSEYAILVENLAGVVYTGNLVSHGFKEQFQSLPSGLIKAHEVAGKVENRPKNRYKDLFPYDKNRVIVRHGTSNNTGYINANYVHGFNKPCAYIATQGPLANTLNDFWEMVWQTDCGKIIMLTNLVEQEKPKCEQYWPDDGSLQFGKITVRLVDTEIFSEFIVRTLALHKDSITERLVVQFHFTAWPDKCVPKYASSIVHFWNKAKHLESNSNGPAVVHCSAGVGRTGTYIALDYLADQAQSLGYVDVVSCVRTLRNQRVNLVQTLDQYIFVHHALVEALMLSTSALPAVKFQDAYRELLQIDPVTQKRNLTLAFEMLKKMSPIPDEFQYVTAKDIANRKKNRYNNILPVDEFMPKLSGTGQHETDYINAVYLPSYKEKSAFIVTQLPLENTKLDFWRLVYEHDVHTIVMLNDVSQARKAEIYWPEDDQKVVYGYNTVENLATEAMESHRVVRMQLSTHDKTRTIKQFQCRGWKPGATVPDNPSCILLLLELVQAWQQRSGNHPIIVHCMDGAERSGLYCVISAVLERMKVEQDVAISHVIEEMRNRREQIISSEVQFQFCHEAVLSFMEQHDTYSNFNA